MTSYGSSKPHPITNSTPILSTLSFDQLPASLVDGFFASAFPHDRLTVLHTDWLISNSGPSGPQTTQKHQPYRLLLPSFLSVRDLYPLLLRVRSYDFSPAFCHSVSKLSSVPCHSPPASVNPFPSPPVQSRLQLSVRDSIICPPRIGVRISTLWSVSTLFYCLFESISDLISSTFSSPWPHWNWQMRCANWPFSSQYPHILSISDNGSFIHPRRPRSHSSANNDQRKRPTPGIWPWLNIHQQRPNTNPTTSRPSHLHQRLQPCHAAVHPTPDVYLLRHGWWSRFSRRQQQHEQHQQPGQWCKSFAQRGHCRFQFAEWGRGSSAVLVCGRFRWCWIEKPGQTNGFV